MSHTFDALLRTPDEIVEATHEDSREYKYPAHLIREGRADIRRELENPNLEVYRLLLKKALDRLEHADTIRVTYVESTRSARPEASDVEDETTGAEAG